MRHEIIVGLVSYLNCLDFTVHKLILSGCSFESIFSQVHWIAPGVNISEYLHWHMGRKMRRHVIKPSQVSHYLIPTTNATH
jgi:hypothetical protein